jgi:hypothetical protein
MKNRLKLNEKPDNRYLNGAGKYQQEQYQKRVDAYNLNPLKCTQCDKIMDYDYVKKNTKNVKFCSHSCSAIYNNSRRDCLTKGLMKTCKCVVCSDVFEISLHASSKNLTCNKCKSINLQKKTIKSKCTICESEFNHYQRHKKTCSNDCKKIALVRAGSKGGRKSVLSQQKRSKNEIYFYELCTTKFTNVLHNEQLFNGWDADVILPDFKIAILWNGIWHYKKVYKKHSLEQQMSRDKIKIKEIIGLNFVPYVIKDMGKHNKDKVEKEFDIFCKWLDEKRIAGDGTAPSST